MRKTVKATAFALVAALVFCISFAGCGGDSGEKLVNSKGQVVVRVSIPEGSISKQAKELLKEFEKENPDITFKEEPIVGEYTTKLIAQASSGTAPDLIWVSDINARMLASKKLLEPLEGYYKANNFNASDVYESMLQCGQYDGKQYMIPRDYNHIVTYYNKKLFDQAGVAYPQDGWTWQQFLDTSYKLTKKSGSIYTQRACDPFIYWGATGPLIFMGLGGTITDKFPGGSKANFNTKGSVAALKQIKKLVDDGVFVNHYKNDIGSFNSGKVAMSFQTRSSCSTYVSSIGEENLGVTTFPILPENHYVGSGTSGYAVIKTSKCKEEATRFLFYVISKKGQKVFMKSADCVPVLKSLAKDTTWQNTTKSLAWEPFLDHPEYDVLQPSITVASDSASLKFDSAWSKTMSAVLTDILDPEEAAKFGQTEMETAFAGND